MKKNKILNKVFYGDEVLLPEIHTQAELASALSWQKNNVSVDELYKSAIKYAQKENLEPKKVKEIDKDFFRTLGALVRIVEHNDITTIELRPRFEKIIDEKWENKPKEIETPKCDEKRYIPVPEVDEQLNDIFEMFDDRIDRVFSGTKQSPIDKKLISQLNNKQKFEIKKYLSNFCKELSDDQIFNECYNLSDNQRSFLIELLNEWNKLFTMERKKKPKSKNNLNKLNYLENSDEWKMRSINPDKVIGAQNVLTFNTKTRVVTIYRAEDPGGIGIKGTTLTGVSGTSSQSTKDRKPLENTKLMTTKNKIETIFNKMSGLKKTNPSTRIGKDTLILKAY